MARKTRQGQREEGSMERRRKPLSSKDLIAIGVFSLLFIIVSMLVVSIASISLIVYLGACALAAIPAGVVWAYLHVRIPRFGTSLIMGAVFALLIFVMGSGWPVALGLVAGALLSEAARAIAGYGRFAGIAVGYALFETAWAAGLFAPMFAMPDYYKSLMGSNSIDPSFQNALLSTVTPEVFALIAAITFAGGIAGALLGRAVLKRHFEKAGIL